MKKFTKSTILFLLPIIICGIVAEILLHHIPNDYRKKRTFLDKNSNKVSTLILGSSHTFYGVNPIYLHHGISYNSAYVSQSLYYDLAILKRYESKWNNLKYIIIPIDYFSFFLDLNNEFQKNSYNMYFGLKDKDRNLLDNTEILGNQFKLNMMRIYRYYIEKHPSSTSSNLGWGTEFTAKKSQSVSELNRSGLKFADRHLRKNDELYKSQTDILKAILNFATKNNIRVLLFTAPCYKSYNMNLNKSQLDSTINTVKIISSKFDNTIYKNLLRDTAFKDYDFYNPDHLNENGAKKLTKKIDVILNNLANK